MDFLLVGVTFLLAFLLRVPLLFKYRWVGVDTFTHLLCALKIRKSKSLFGGREWVINDSEGIKHYPPLFHLFLSLFPEKLHRKMQIFPTFFDLLTLFTLLFFVQSFIHDRYIPLALAVYCLAPISILSSLTLSPRTISNLFLTISLIFLFFYITFNNLFYLLLFIFSTTPIFLLHKLTLQSLFTVILFISLVFFNVLPLTAFLCSFAVVMLLTKAKYKKVLEVHIKNLIRHFKTGHYLYRKKRPENPIKLFFACPFIIIPIVYIILNGFTPQFLFFQVWFFSLLFISFFWIWGDGYRYLTNAIFPASVLTTIFLEELPYSNIILALLILASFIGIGYIFWKFITSRRTIKNEFIECCERIRKKAKRKDTLAVFSPQSYWYVGAYLTRVNTYPSHYYKDKRVLKDGELKTPTWVITYEDRINHNYKLEFRKGKFKVFRLCNKF